MPQMLQMRIADADKRPIQAHSFEVALRQALLKEFPVASAVDVVDDKFVQLLETMAALDLGGTVHNLPVQSFREITQTPVCAPTDLGCIQTDSLSRVA